MNNIVSCVCATLAVSGGYTPLYIGLGIVGLALGFTFLANKVEKDDRRRLVNDRPSLTDDELYRDFFADASLSIEAFSVAWKQIAKHLAIDPGKLRPSDRLAWLDTSITAMNSDVDYLLDEVAMHSPAGTDLKYDTATVGDLVECLVTRTAA